MNEYQLNIVVIKVFLESNMSQLDFSKKYNLNYSTLNHVLNKETVCGFRFLQKLSNNMGKNLIIKLE